MTKEQELKPCSDCNDTGMTKTNGHDTYCGCILGLYRFSADRSSLSPSPQQINAIEEAKSWRRVAERLEGENQDLRAQIASLTLTS